MTKTVLRAAILVGAAAILTACGGHKATTSTGSGNATATPGVAVVKTSEGSFSIQLDAQSSPHTVGSFEQLARTASSTARSSTGSSPVS